MTSSDNSDNNNSDGARTESESSNLQNLPVKKVSRLSKLFGRGKIADSQHTDSIETNETITPTSGISKPALTDKPTQTQLDARSCTEGGPKLALSRELERSSRAF